MFWFYKDNAFCSEEEFFLSFNSTPLQIVLLETESGKKVDVSRKGKEKVVASSGPTLKENVFQSPESRSGSDSKRKGKKKDDDD